MDFSVVACTYKRKVLWLFDEINNKFGVCISDNEHRYVWKEKILCKNIHTKSIKLNQLQENNSNVNPPQWIFDLLKEYPLFVLKETDLVSKDIHKEYSIVTGTLKISSKTQWGINSKGLRKYSFIPLYSRGNYPMYVVASKLRPSSLDVYVRVEINAWNQKDKHPTGNLVEVLGNINEIEKFDDIIVSASGIIPRTRNPVYRKSCEYVNTTTHTQIDENWSQVDTISIDPSGSRDIDDALSIRKLDDTHFEFAVHIASPTVLFDIDSKIDNISKLQTSSIYTKNKTIHLLPEHISTSKASLLENEERECLSVIWSNKTGPRVRRTKVINKCTASYDDVNLKDNNSLYFQIHKIMGEIFKVQIPKDSHKCVEYAMIQANKFIGEFLVENMNENAILRRTIGNSAYYLPYCNGLDNSHKHLELEFYTHFTSPIRRYADQVVHRMIYSILDSHSEKIYKVPYIHLNNIKNHSKIIDSELKWLDLIQNKQSLIEGILIDIQDEFAVVSFSENKYFIRMIPEDLKDLIKIQKDNNIVQIIYNDSNKMTFHLNKDVRVKLFWISELGIKGIKFEWIQPAISSFISSC